ncbi:MAG: cytidine deaminase [Blautia sp.]|nr:cytidine deaminase [Blautia sp.]
MTPETIENLITEAFLARELAYVPYSDFAVGAALLSEEGTVFRGCNIENAAYTPTNCAERTAVFKAVSEGIRNFQAIAIVGGKQELSAGQVDYCPPCGLCRQVLREFCDPEAFVVILATSAKEYKTFLLKDLLPMSFGPGSLASQKG